jgi:hypothetical protein
MDNGLRKLAWKISRKFVDEMHDRHGIRIFVSVVQKDDLVIITLSNDDHKECVTELSSGFSGVWEISDMIIGSFVDYFISQKEVQMK